MLSTTVFAPSYEMGPPPLSRPQASVPPLEPKGGILCTATKIPYMYFFSGNSAASAPISTFMCLWAVCIVPGSSSRRGRPIVEIYKWLIDAWMWKLGQRPRYSFSGNICFEISVFCLCSVRGWGSPNSNGLRKSLALFLLCGFKPRDLFHGKKTYIGTTTKCHTFFSFTQVVKKEGLNRDTHRQLLNVGGHLFCPADS